MNYQEIINRVSADTGISNEIVDRTYKAFWSFVRIAIQSLPLKEEMTEEKFTTLRPNFNIPSIGKLTCTYDRYRGVKEKFNHIKKLRKSNESIKED